jgi:hypothetical protein
VVSCRLALGVYSVHSPVCIYPAQALCVYSVHSPVGATKEWKERAGICPHSLQVTVVGMGSRDDALTHAPSHT